MIVTAILQISSLTTAPIYLYEASNTLNHVSSLGTYPFDSGLIPRLLLVPSDFAAVLA
jgi:hypothetical protein